MVSIDIVGVVLGCICLSVLEVLYCCRCSRCVGVRDKVLYRGCRWTGRVTLASCCTVGVEGLGE